MGDCDPHADEPHAAMCKRTDASLAAMLASATSACCSPSYEAVTVKAEARESDRQDLLQQFEKKETPTETWRRVSQKREAKTAKSIKTVAKKWVKQKKTMKMTSHFARKQCQCRVCGSSLCILGFVIWFARMQTRVCTGWWAVKMTSHFARKQCQCRVSRLLFAFLVLSFVLLGCRLGFAPVGGLSSRSAGWLFGLSWSFSGSGGFGWSCLVVWSHRSVTRLGRVGVSGLFISSVGWVGWSGHGRGSLVGSGR
jgi:hypothetical protein